MRMWMVNPKLMCRKHLLGEHVEIHMIVGHMSRKRKIEGFVRNNCIEPSSIVPRHAELAIEMEQRGYKHSSGLKVPQNLLDYLTTSEREVKVDIESSLEDLTNRCEECRSRRMQDA